MEQALISSVGLRRFRGHANTTLELKPLTVILGANNAGKSSILQAIAALRYIRSLRSTPATLMPNVDAPYQWPLDFGGRETLQRYGSLDEGGIGIEIATRGRDGAEGRVAYEFGRPGSRSLDLSMIEIDEGFVVADPTPRAAVVAEGGHDWTVAVPGSGGVTPADEEASPTEQLVTIPATRHFLRRTDDGNSNSWRDERRQMPVVASFSNLELQAYFLGSTLSNVSSRRQVHVLDTLDKVRYLRAMRAPPRRLHEVRPAAFDVDDVGAFGQWTAETLYATQHTKVETRAQPPETFDRTEATRYMTTPRTVSEEPLSDVANFWTSRLGIAASASANRSGGALSLDVVIGQGGSPTALPDAGFGVSQILPIVVQGLALPVDGTLLVEQPEAQLHPKAQGLVADFFCAMAEAGRNAVVETHSEAFFRRLQLRALLDPSLAEKVAVYFIAATSADGCAEPQRVEIGGRAGIKWPSGFMGDGLRAQASFAAVMAAKSGAR